MFKALHLRGICDLICHLNESSVKKSRHGCGRWAPQPYPLSVCPEVPVSWCLSVLVSQCPGVSVSQCPRVPVCKCDSVLVSQSLSVLMSQCPGHLGTTGKRTRGGGGTHKGERRNTQGGTEERTRGNRETHKGGEAEKHTIFRTDTGSYRGGAHLKIA